MNDSISDMLTRIRNAYLGRLTETSIPYSKMKLELAKLLSEKGFIGEVKVGQDKHSIEVSLRYVDGVPTLQKLRRVSRPGLRVYSKALGMKKVRGGLGMIVVSTSQGLMSGYEARKKHLGGEVIAEVF
jgi:small subunit ribosomal protein S8